MLPSAPVPGIRQILENHVSRVSTELEALVADARQRDRSHFASQLNQAMRRIRLAVDLDELAATLLDVSAGFAGGAAVLRAGQGGARGVRIRGVSDAAAEEFADAEIPLASAAALAGAIETRDPVSAVTSAGEVSRQLVEIAGHAGNGRAWIFPLAAGDRVPALLYCWGAVEIAVLELLAQAAAPAWIALETPRKAAAAGLVRIGGQPAAPGSAWDSLSPEEQKIHLRAQRFARVEAAEMRLRQAEAVRAGRTQRDLYGALRHSMDAAREEFRRTYFVNCPSMVDYLHLELVRTLANDDAELLGKDYPGPLV